MALFTYPLHEHPFVQFNCTGDFSVKTGVCLFSSCVVKLSHRGHTHCVNRHFSSYIKEEFVPLQFKGFSCFYVKTLQELLWRLLAPRCFFYRGEEQRDVHYYKQGPMASGLLWVTLCGVQHISCSWARRVWLSFPCWFQFWGTVLSWDFLFNTIP